MNHHHAGEELVRELLENPEAFTERGDANELLQEYFHGRSLNTLRPLLAHGDRLVRRSAAFIASELGARSQPLIHQVAPLVHDNDPHTRWYAVESVAVCSVGANAEMFILVVKQLEDDNDWMRRLAMRLMSYSDQDQIRAAYGICSRLETTAFQHSQGLKLLQRRDLVKKEQVIEMLESSTTLPRKYGAIAAVRLFDRFPGLIENATQNSDEDVSEFSIKSLKRLTLRRK